MTDAAPGQETAPTCGTSVRAAQLEGLLRRDERARLHDVGARRPQLPSKAAPLQE